MFESGLVLLWTALLLGLRHSFDMDHVAAITDICAAETDRRRGLLYSFGYSAGHALIVLILGVAAMALGLVLPPGLEAIMGKVVGVTLLLLAAAVLYSALRYRSAEKLLSRWRILAGLMRWLVSRHSHKHDKKASHTHESHAANDTPASTRVGFWGSAVIGVLHGLGVESPTQLVILTSAASVSWALGLSTVLIFASGILVANMALALVVVTGFQSAKRQQLVFMALSIISALLGVYMGVSLLME
ncbi:MAG: hypothetical protein K2W95_14780 [Candidatus Obscuribacterales bacterium]|nr:hypothetical protein [Candidatus Obscuribacterales bacterium]